MWIIVFIVVGALNGLLAWRKGYSFIIWFFAVGLIGLLIVCLLPYANEPHQSLSEQEELQKKGNMYGLIIIAFLALFLCCQFRQLSQM